MNKIFQIMIVFIVFTNQLNAQDPNSIVDMLKLTGRPSDFESRTKMYNDLFGNGSDYTGSQQQNTRMMGTLRVGDFFANQGEQTYGVFQRAENSQVGGFSGKPNRPFYSDGCTNVPDFDFGQTCCAWHDRDYARGGYAQDRLDADLKFRDCIKSHGHPVLGEVYFQGVRMFGGSYFNWNAESISPPANNLFDDFEIEIDF